MRLLFAGTPANAAISLRELVASRHEVAVVLTREDAPVGRKRELTASPVARAAEELGIPVIKANQVDEVVLTHLKAFSPDLGVVVAYGALLNATAISALPKGWVNLHFSLLPDWRGAAPVQRAIQAGDRLTGVTLFQIDEGLDTGAIWGQVPVEINSRENSAELLNRLTSIGASLLNEQLPRIEAGLSSAQPQSGAGRLARKLQRSEAKLDFNRTAIEIEHAVRAFNPEPIAYAMAGNEAFRVLDAVALGSTDWSALENDTTNEVGSLLVQDNRVLVRCGLGTLVELKTVQPSGKKPMSALDWSRGSRISKLV